MSRVAYCLALFGLLCSAAVAQPPRPMQQGTKLLPDMYVAWTAHSTPLADLATAVPRAFIELAQACVDNELHPLQVFAMVVHTEQPLAAGLPLQWEAWMMIADEPTPADLGPEAVVRVKKVPSARVAFTYHAGPIADLSNTFINLAGWALGQGLDVTGEARVVLIGLPTPGDQDGLLFECQLALDR